MLPDMKLVAFLPVALRYKLVLYFGAGERPAYFPEKEKSNPMGKDNTKQE
jgi:hypothetical protein